MALRSLLWAFVALSGSSILPSFADEVGRKGDEKVRISTGITWDSAKDDEVRGE